MKKSTIWTLVISIILIVLSFVLTACGIYQSARQVTYDYGFGYYRTVTFNGYTPMGHMLKTFGTMCFVLGIGGMVLFTYLAVTTPGNEKRSGRPHSPNEPKRSAAEEKKEFADSVRKDAVDIAETEKAPPEEASSGEEGSSTD